VAFFAQQHITGKDLSDVCELLTYEFHEKDDHLVEYDVPYESMFIILDGQIDFSLNLKQHKVQDKHII